jgi:hypothetical protein
VHPLAQIGQSELSKVGSTKIELILHNMKNWLCLEITPKTDYTIASFLLQTSTVSNITKITYIASYTAFFKIMSRVFFD